MKRQSLVFAGWGLLLIQLVVGIILIANPAGILPGSLSDSQAITLLGRHLSAQGLVLGLAFLVAVLSNRSAFLGAILMVGGISNLADSGLNILTPGTVIPAQLPALVIGVISLVLANRLLAEGYPEKAPASAKALGSLVTVMGVAVGVAFFVHPLWSAPAGMSGQTAIGFLSHHQSTMDIAFAICLAGSLLMKHWRAAAYLVGAVGALYILDAIFCLATPGAVAVTEWVSLLVGLVAVSVSYSALRNKR